MSNHFKSKILQYIILPSVSASYENNEQQALIHGTSDPSDSTGNIVTSYIYQVLHYFYISNKLSLNVCQN